VLYTLYTCPWFSWVSGLACCTAGSKKLCPQWYPLSVGEGGRFSCCCCWLILSVGKIALVLLFALPPSVLDMVGFAGGTAVLRGC